MSGRKESKHAFRPEPKDETMCGYCGQGERAAIHQRRSAPPVRMPTVDRDGNRGLTPPEPSLPTCTAPGCTNPGCPRYMRAVPAAEQGRVLCDEHLSYGVKRTQAGLVVTEDDPEGRFKAGDRVTEAQRAAFNIPVASTQSPQPSTDVVVCKTCKATTPADVWKLAAERAQSVVKLRAERDTAEQLLTAAVKDYEEAIAALRDLKNCGALNIADGDFQGLRDAKRRAKELLRDR